MYRLLIFYQDQVSTAQTLGFWLRKKNNSSFGSEKKQTLAPIEIKCQASESFSKFVKIQNLMEFLQFKVETLSIIKFSDKLECTLLSCWCNSCTQNNIP